MICDEKACEKRACAMGGAHCEKSYSDAERSGGERCEGGGESRVKSRGSSRRFAVAKVESRKEGGRQRGREMLTRGNVPGGWCGVFASCGRAVLRANRMEICASLRRISVFAVGGDWSWYAGMVVAWEGVGPFLRRRQLSFGLSSFPPRIAARRCWCFAASVPSSSRARDFRHFVFAIRCGDVCVPGGRLWRDGDR